MTPETMDSMGLEGFEALPDAAAIETVNAAERILRDRPSSGGDLDSQLIRARLEAFIYGYRLGRRPAGLEG